MKKIYSLFIISILFVTCTFAQFPKIVVPKMLTPENKKGITNEQAVSGLKQALNVGTDTAVSILTKADGFYKDELVKILLPPEAQSVYKNVGLRVAIRF